MTVTPSGSLSLAQHYLRLMLADADAVRTWLGVSTQEAALERIHLNGLPRPNDGHRYTRDEMEKLRPFAVVYHESSRFSIDAVGAANLYADSGRLTVRLEQNSPSESDDDPTDDAGTEWMNTVGAIASDVLSLSGTDSGYLHISDLAVDGPYCNWPTHEVTEGRWMGAELEVSWR